MKSLVLCLTAIVLLVFAVPTFGQDEAPTSVTVQNRSGDLPFSTSIGTDIEHVDVSSGNLIIHIPLTTVKGRGMDFNFGLNYDARFWVVGARQPAGQPASNVWNVVIGNYLP